MQPAERAPTATQFTPWRVLPTQRWAETATTPINTTVWEIYGPRAGGAWGTGTPLRGNRRNGSGEQREAIFGQTTDTGGGGTSGLQSLVAGEGITITPESNPKVLKITNKVLNSRTLPLISPSIPDGLETQEDYNLFVYDALSNLGQGEGGIETFPWIRIYMFKSEPSMGSWFYQTSWETNTNATYTWQWEVDANNTDDFIDIAEHPQKTELGFDGREYSNGLFLSKIGQESTFPNAKIRQRITSQINTSPVNELSTPIMQMWEIFEDVIDEPLYSKGESGGGSGGSPFATNDRVDAVQQEVNDLSAAQGTTQNEVDTLQSEVDTQQSEVDTLQSEVDTLQNKVTALEGTVIDGKWKLDNRTVARIGYYLALSGINNATTWESVTSIQMNPEDEGGQTFTFAQVAIGDVIRIGAIGSSAIFRCTSTFTQSGDVYNATVELLNSSGTPVETLSYDFEFLPSFDPSAFATVDYVDQQDAKSLKLEAQNDVTTSFRIKNNNKTLISTATTGELGLYHVKDPSEGNPEWAATKGYVDKVIAEASLGRRFKLGTWNDVVNSDGEPGWLDTGQGSSASANWIAMSLVDLDGLKVHHDCTVTGDFSYGMELPFTMYAYINDEWEIVAGGKSRAETDCKSNHFQLSEVTWGKFYPSTSNRNQIVRIKIGGLW